MLDQKTPALVENISTVLEICTEELSAVTYTVFKMLWWQSLGTPMIDLSSTIVGQH